MYNDTRLIAKIKDLKVNNIVNVSGIIISKDSKEYKAKDGSLSKFLYGIIEDETGSIVYKVWSTPKIDLNVNFNEGESIVVYRAEVKEWNSVRELHITKNSIIKKGTNLAMENKVTYVKDITDEYASVTVCGLIKNNLGNMFSIDDGTGSIEIYSSVPVVEGKYAKIIHARTILNATYHTIRLSIERYTKIEYDSHCKPGNIMNISDLKDKKYFPKYIVLKGDIIKIENIVSYYYCSLCRKPLSGYYKCGQHPDSEVVSEKHVKCVLNDNTYEVNVTIPSKLIDEKELDVKKLFYEKVLFKSILAEYRVRVGNNMEFFAHKISILDDNEDISNKVDLLNQIEED
jgi:hypothetical protein